MGTPNITRLLFLSSLTVSILGCAPPSTDDAPANSRPISAETRQPDSFSRKGERLHPGDVVTLNLKPGVSIHSVRDPAGSFPGITYEVSDSQMRMSVPNVKLEAPRGLEILLTKKGETNPFAVKTILIYPLEAR